MAFSEYLKSCKEKVKLADTQQPIAQNVSKQPTDPQFWNSYNQWITIYSQFMLTSLNATTKHEIIQKLKLISRF